MATLTSKSKPREPREPKEKKFKKFKITLEFTDRDDAVAFAGAIQEYDDELSKDVVELAHR